MSNIVISFESRDAILTALESARRILEALNDGMFAPDGPAPAELTFYPKAREGMAYIMEDIAARLDTAIRHINGGEAED